MSSTYPMYGNVPGQPCMRCGLPLPPNQARCPRCGFGVPGVQANPQSLTGGQFPPQNPPGMTSAPNSFSGIPQSGQRQQAPNTIPFQGMPAQSNANGQYPQSASLPGMGQRFQPTSMPGVGNANPSSQSFPGIAGRNIQGSALPSTPAPGQNMGPVSFAGMSGSGTGNFAPPSASLAGMARPGQQEQQVQRPTLATVSQTANVREGQKRKGKGRTIILTLLLVFLVAVAATSGYVFFTSITTGKAVTSFSSQPTHIMNPYPAEKTQPLFGDFFRDNSNQWDVDSQTGKYAVKIGGGNLTLQDMNNSILPEFLPTSQAFTNFKLLVDAKMISGNAKNGYGVYIRASVNQQGQLTTYYRMELYGDGTYAIFKGMLDGNGNPNPNAVKIVSYTPDTIIQKEGTVNHIEVVANGASITFMANSRPLYAFSDGAYSSGSIALFVSNPQDVPAGVVATFSKLAVFPVGS